MNKLNSGGDRSEMQQVESLIINFNEEPSCPVGLRLLPKDQQPSNRVRDWYKWEPEKMALYLSEKQKKAVIARPKSFLECLYRAIFSGETGRGVGIDSSILQEDLSKKTVFPANLLDELIKEKNWHLVPKEFERVHICLWGTRYLNLQGHVFIRWFYFADGKVTSGTYLVSYKFDRGLPALIKL